MRFSGYKLYFCISLQAVLLLILLVLLPNPIWEHLYPKSVTSRTEHKGLSPTEREHLFEKPSFTQNRKTTSIAKTNFSTTVKKFLTSQVLPLQSQPARTTDRWKVRPVTTITAMPLQAKDFSAEPEWEIEEDYTLAASASETSCPISVKIKALNSSWLKERFLTRITVFMDSRHFSDRDWVRLGHFVPPYGWMELNYKVVQEVVWALPRIPDQQLLLAEKSKDTVPRCVSCAVVGNGGILNASGLGREIDEHDYVFRVNGAVIKGYEKDVGIRTSFYGFTAFTMLSSLHLLHGKGFPTIPQDKETKYIHFPELRRDYEWLKALQQNKEISKGTLEQYRLRPRDDFGDNFDFNRLLVAHPDFVRYLKNRFLRSSTLKGKYWSIYRPSTGALVLLTALHLCDTEESRTLAMHVTPTNIIALHESKTNKNGSTLKSNNVCRSYMHCRFATFWIEQNRSNGGHLEPVFSRLEVSAYGFMTEDFKLYSDHYYDKKKRKVTFYANHDFLMEKELWARLHHENIIKLYQKT